MNAIIRYLYNFLTDGTDLLFCTVPIYLFVRMLYLKHCRRIDLRKKFLPDREVIMLGFFMFLIMLFTQTFVVNSGKNEIKLIPFDIIISQIISMYSSDAAYTEFIFNITGNIGVFIPIGIFAAYLFRTDLKKTVFIGFFISFFIETVQLPLERTSDVDDLILNTVGALIGYSAYKLCKKISEKQVR